MADEEQQIQQEPAEKSKEIALPWEFYNYRGWYESLMKFYADDKNLLPRPVLDNPVKALIVAVRDVIDVYGNFPSDTAQALEYSINPLYEPGEYHSKVYEPLRLESVTKSDSNLMFMADGLFAIRAFFEKDEEFMQERFMREVEGVPQGNSPEERLEYFAETIRNITKTHVGQVIKMIRDYLKQQNVPA